MKTALIFTSGIITGIVAVPTTILYVKPVRRVVQAALAKGIEQAFNELRNEKDGK